MEFSPQSPPDARPCWQRPGWLALAALACYAIFLLRHVDACAGGSDSSGYLNQARLLGSGHTHAPVRALPGLSRAATPEYLYVPLGFRPEADGRSLVGTYPVGLPLLIRLAVPFAGWRHACDLVIVLHALAGILLTYALGRLFRLSRPWALLGAAILAASPLYVEYSLQAMSDLPAMVWVVAAVAAAWRGGTPPQRGGVQAGSTTRLLHSKTARSTPWPTVAGAAFAVAVIIRPSNLVVVAPVLLALGWPSRRWLWFGAGGLPGALVLAVYNRHAYGHYLTTGYGDAWSSFSSGLVPLTLRHYLHWLPLIFTPVVAFALLLPWAARRRPREALVLGAWAIVVLGFYAAYYNTHESWWYLRFLLPAMPALIVGGLLVLSDLAGARLAQPGMARAAFALALAAVIANGVYWNCKFQSWTVGHGEANYRRTAEWLQGHVPADAVLATMQVSGAVFYYTDYAFVRWDQLQGPQFGPVRAAARAAHRPLYAVLFPFELEDALKSRMPGHWEEVGAVRGVTIWRLQD